MKHVIAFVNLECKKKPSIDYDRWFYGIPLYKLSSEELELQELNGQFDGQKVGIKDKCKKFMEEYEDGIIFIFSKCKEISRG